MVELFHGFTSSKKDTWEQFMRRKRKCLNHILRKSLSLWYSVKLLMLKGDVCWTFCLPQWKRISFTRHCFLGQCNSAVSVPQFLAHNMSGTHNEPDRSAFCKPFDQVNNFLSFSQLFYQAGSHKQRYLFYLKNKLPKERATMAPNPCATCWSSWFFAVQYPSEHSV